MALTCNAFTPNTIPATQSQVFNLSPCPEMNTEQFIDPPTLHAVVIDALARALAILKPGFKISTIPPADLFAVFQNARQSVFDGKAQPLQNPTKNAALLLYLANEINCNA